MNFTLPIIIDCCDYAATAAAATTEPRMQCCALLQQQLLGTTIDFKSSRKLAPTYQFASQCTAQTYTAHTLAPNTKDTHKQQQHFSTNTGRDKKSLHTF